MVSTATGLDSEVIKRIPAQDLIKMMKDNMDFEYELRREILSANNIACRYV